MEWILNIIYYAILKLMKRELEFKKKTERKEITEVFNIDIQVIEYVEKLVQYLLYITKIVLSVMM